MSTNELDTLPATGFLRQTDLVGARERPANGGKPARPARRGIIPFSQATLWRKVKDGTFPAPVKLSAGVTAWRVEDVRAWMAERK
jgi:prophage regulatory protein